jgi:glycosyltransferase involved in cell wall biosynthesis
MKLGINLAGRFLKSAAERLRSHLKAWLVPQITFIPQYPPRPLAIPSHYGRTRAPRRAPVISVVTPSFNQVAFLEQTMLSALGQDYPHLEYIVQDGGSTDGSVALVQQYGPRLTSWQSQRDRGQAHAINLGFQRATGEILAYLNSDDMLTPGTLAYVARYFLRHPKVDVVYGHRIIVDAQGQETGRWVLPPHADEDLLWEDWVPQETMFWRRGIWERIGGGLDESFHFAMDWDLILRFRAAGARFARLPRFLGVFRVQAEQKTLTRLDLLHAETDRLLQREHGRRVTRQDIVRARMRYLRSRLLYQNLYSWGLLRC